MTEIVSRQHVTDGILGPGIGLGSDFLSNVKSLVMLLSESCISPVFTI